MTTAEMTVKDWLDSMASTNQSTDQDSVKMQNLLRRVGFSQAICTVGVVYLKGQGTPDAPPTDIHTIARMLLKVK